MQQKKKNGGVRFKDRVRVRGLGLGMGLDVWLGGSIGLGIGMGLDVGLGMELDEYVGLGIGMGLGLVVGVLFFLRSNPLPPKKWEITELEKTN